MSDPSREHPLDLLSAYLDDELGLEERARVDRHLADCGACRDDLASLRRLSGAVAEEDVPPVPADLADRIGARIDAAKVRPFRRRIVVPVTIAATLAAVGLVIVYQWTAPSAIREARPPSPNESPVRTERDELAKTTASPTPPPPPALAPSGRSANEPLPADSAAPAAPPANERRDRQVPEPAPANAAAPAPVPAFDADKKAEAAGAVEGKEKEALRHLGYVGGVAGETAGGTAGEAASRDRARAKDEGAPAPRAQSVVQEEVAAAVSAAKRASYQLASSCGDRWVDAGVVGTWVVGDMQPALRELDAVAAQVAGRGSSEPVGRGEPYEFVVPRAGYAELLTRLRARGVSGIDPDPALPPGDACVRQRISIQVVLGGAPAPSPR